MEELNFDFEEVSNGLGSSMIAGEVGLGAIETLMNYYPRMLSTCLKMIAEMTGKEPKEARLHIEEHLGLQGVFDSSLKQLTYFLLIL